MATLGDIGELAAIRRLTRNLPSRPDIVIGVGDDCAVVRPHPGSLEDWVLTSDPVVEGVHFEPGTAPARVGHKAIGRALSDIAAMGATPLWGLVNIVAPPHTPEAYLDGLYDGGLALAGRHGLAVVGGDLSEGPTLQLHVFAVGRVPAGGALLRSGARPGDGIYVTGELGGSRGGRHLDFEPRVAEGRRLLEWATAAVDLSDGVASDLRHLLDMSEVGCTIDTDAIPISAAARQASDGRAALSHALHDGEDFELLFTIPQGKKGLLRRIGLRPESSPARASARSTAQRAFCHARPRTDRSGSWTKAPTNTSGRNSVHKHTGQETSA